MENRFIIAGEGGLDVDYAAVMNEYKRVPERDHSGRRNLPMLIAEVVMLINPGNKMT